MRRRRLHRRERKLRNKKIIIASICLICIMAVGFAAFQTQISLSAKGNVKERTASEYLKTLVTSSGDGLYRDAYENNRYVFKGKNPNNFIKLNDDLYRIISIENDNTLKVIKNDSIGSFALDTSGARYDSTGTTYCKSNAGCKVWGSKTTMLDSNEQNTTVMSREINGTTYTLPNEEASLNTYLNNTFYNSVNSAVKEKIVSHIFNVGLIHPSETNLSNTINTEKLYKWRGRVGLINVSDFIRASLDSSCISVYKAMHAEYPCQNQNFLSFDDDYWLLDALSQDTSQYGWFVYNTNDYAAPSGHWAGAEENVRPVLFLSSDIKLTGSGTENDAYVLSN